jgi:co-chaperonin GroES (HSP10)
MAKKNIQGELILVGDKVLIEPDDENNETPSGLLLPATVKEKDRIRGGYVVGVGPGYGMPNPDYSADEPWKPAQDAVRYLALQANVGDYAFFLRKETIELEFQDKTYLIIPHGAILALIRNQPDERDLYGFKE